MPTEHINESVTSHSVSLSGLTADVQYQARVRSTDASGNTSAWSDWVPFSTSASRPRPTVTFPAAAGVHNVVTAGADPTGVDDSTSAILQLIRNVNAGAPRGQTIYFPEGTYKVSDQFDWKKADGDWCNMLAFQGQHRDRTILRIPDNATGFTSASTPKALIYTASAAPQNQEQIDTGSGNQAYQNHVMDMTIDTGNNPGAIGLDWMAHNVGALKRVKVVGNGVAGIDMTRPWPGPCMLVDVEVDGFSYGIRVAWWQQSVVLEDIVLTNQTVKSLENHRNTLAIRKLQATGAVTNNHLTGVIGMVESPGVTVSDDLGFTIVDPPAYTIVPKETPVVPYDPISDWANVDDYPSQQAALNSGKSTVYYPAQGPSGTFYRWVDGTTLEVPATVRRIVFMMSGPAPRNLAVGQAMFKTVGATDTPLVFERAFFPIGEQTHKDWYYIDHSSTRPLVLQHMMFGGGTFKPNCPAIRQAVGAGTVFIEDSAVSLGVTGEAYGRQVNTETSPNTGGVFNTGGTFWALGLKSEGAHTLIRTTQGGRSEMLGSAAFPYSQSGGTIPATVAAIETIDAEHEVQYGTVGYFEHENYTVQVRETVNGVTTELLTTSPEVASRGGWYRYIRDSGPS